MNESNEKNYTPISVDTASNGGVFSGLMANKRNLGIVGGVLALVLAIGVGFVALRQPQTLTTPAQTINDVDVALACPDGYKKIDVPSIDAADTNVGDTEVIQKLCPGGDIIFVDGGASKETKPGIDDSANVIIGDGDTTGGDTTTVNQQIVCCRPQLEVTPIQEVTPEIPEDDVTPTPEACFVPKLEIIEIELECPDCQQ